MMYKTLIVLLVLAQFACSNAPSAKKEIKIDDQGVNIHYTDSQAGDTVLLFVHGWGINQTYWAPQVKAFSPRYRVITLDLPGFGQSGKNRQSWTIEDYGKDVSTVLNKLDLNNVILIGHSMSGAVVVETALTNPSRIRAIVGVDNFKNYGWVETPEIKVQVDSFYRLLRTHYTEVVSTYVGQALFAPSTDSLVKQRVLNDLLGSDSVIAATALEKGDRYPLNEKMAAWKKPFYMINSDFTPTDTAALRKGGIDYVLLNMGPTGHYPMVESPEKFNALLQQAIDQMR